MNKVYFSIDTLNVCPFAFTSNYFTVIEAAMVYVNIIEFKLNHLPELR